MKPIAYVSLPIAEFREKVCDFGKDDTALAEWVRLFSKTLALMGGNEPKDDFAMRLLNDVESWRKEKAEKMRQLREKRSGLNEPREHYDHVVSVEKVENLPAKQKVSKRVFGEHNNVSLTDAEEEKLREKLGVLFDRAISILSNYKASSGHKYKSDYAAINNWVIDRLNEEKVKGSTTMSQAQRLLLNMNGGANGQ